MFTQLEIDQIIDQRVNYQRSLKEVAESFNTDRLTIRKIESAYFRERENNVWR
jgi:hypothetical protein